MMRPSKQQTRFSAQTITRLLRYITEHYRGRLILVVGFILLSAAASVAGSLFLQILIDDYIGPLLGVENPVFTGLFQAIAIMGGIYLAGVVSTYIYNRTMVVIGQGVQKRIRDALFAHMQLLPVKYFDTNSYGDIMSRYTNDIDTLRQMISQSLPTLFSSMVTIVLVFFSMLFTSLPLTIFVLILVSGMLKTATVVAGKSGTYFVQQQARLGEVNGYIEELINGQKVVKVFCYETQAKNQFHEKNGRLFESADSANKYANILMPIMGNLSNLSYVLVAILGGALALGDVGGLTLGAIAAFLQLTKSFNQPVNQMSQQINAVIMALAGAERIFALMDEPAEPDDGQITLVYARYDSAGNLAEAPAHTGLWAWKNPLGGDIPLYTKVEGDIRMTDVNFSYDGENPVLHHISLFARPGEKIAFVGTTGAGKTTITNLLNRFYDIDDGKILYDGIEINKIKKSDLRRSLGIVLQDVNLFTGTILENIRYGRLDATDEEVFAAARLAGADGFVSRLPDGYDTLLTGDASALSQGQRQLLSIARAAVANPPVMILDEATSSIDTHTEKQVQAGMDALMQGRTTFVIAHRLSTIRNSQAILLLDHGKIIERGDHDTLMEQKGRYYQLYAGAFESADEFADQASQP